MKQALIIGFCLVASTVNSHAASSCNFLARDLTINHGNGAIATIKFDQSVVDGSITASNIREGINTGTLQHAQFDGPNVLFIIHWSNTHVGHYTGSVGIIDKRLSGQNFDETNPVSQTTWVTKETFQCN